MGSAAPWSARAETSCGCARRFDDIPFPRHASGLLTAHYPPRQDDERHADAHHHKVGTLTGHETPLPLTACSMCEQAGSGQLDWTKLDWTEPATSEPVSYTHLRAHE